MERAMWMLMQLLQIWMRSGDVAVRLQLYGLNMQQGCSCLDSSEKGKVVALALQSLLVLKLPMKCLS